MNRSDIVAELASRFDQLTQRDSEAAVEAILKAMAEALADGKRPPEVVAKVASSLTGFRHSELSLAKMREKQSARKIRGEYTYSLEGRAGLVASGKAAKGRNHTPESKAIMSAKALSRPPQSPEVRARIAATLRETVGIQSEVSRFIDQLGLTNVEISNRLGVSKSAVSYWRKNGLPEDRKFQLLNLVRKK